MTKRKSDSDDEDPYSKRQKLKSSENLSRSPSKPPSEPKWQPIKIQTLKDLQLLLAFEQDVGPQVKQKVQCFKSFLESIASAKENDLNEREAKCQILLQYLQAQLPLSSDNDVLVFVDLVKTWQFANQANAESLISSVITVLALLLKTISSLIDFREYGNHVSRLLLQDEQLKLFDRILSTNRTKEHLLLPCFRLLTEIVSFDGGHSARIIYRQREVTFKRLEVFLGMLKYTEEEEGAKIRRRPSIRNAALRYLYANLQLQDSNAKMSLLAQGKVTRSLIEGTLEDAPKVVCELLQVLQRDIAYDAEITHTAKGRFFNEWTLSRLCSLYGYAKAEVPAEGHEMVQNATHSLLMLLCTSPGHGVLSVDAVASPRTRKNELSLAGGHENSTDNRGLNEGKGRPSSRNFKLAMFLQGLRPYASLLQSELILAVFSKVPDLISDYFARRKSFPFDPKPTATWIGYYSFLFAVVQQPLPRSITSPEPNRDVPVSCGIVADSVMPPPLTQKIMTRCLNQSTKLISYLSVRLLVAAFEKLRKALQAYKNMQCHAKKKHESDIWERSAVTLVTAFCNRAPEVHHVITQFHECPAGNAILKESITRLLALYYDVIPQAAFGAKFDISTALSNAIQSTILGTSSPQKDDIVTLELGHMFDIAHASPDVQWWHKPENIALSPFTTLLRLYADGRLAASGHRQLKRLLLSLMLDTQLLQSNDLNFSLEILSSSLGSFKDAEPRVLSSIFAFLDNCILRFVPKSVHYYETMADLVASVCVERSPNAVQMDLFLVVIAEQWPFLLKTADEVGIRGVTRWLAKYLDMSWIRTKQREPSGFDRETAKVLVQLRDNIKAATKDPECIALLEDTMMEALDPVLAQEVLSLAPSSETKQVVEASIHLEDVETGPDLDLSLLEPPQEDEDHPGLGRWSHEEIPDAIGEGLIEELILCLCSTYAEIRQQAIKHMVTFATKLETSGYSEQHQCALLIKEVIETATDDLVTTPLPYFAGVLAARILLILADPLHFMYPKINKFLMKGPRWDTKKLPSYWVDKTIMNPPSDDEMHDEEVAWLLDILFDGLRTSADFEIYYRCHIFERLLLLASSPVLPEESFEKIINLLFRCTFVDGSSTLITRCGVLGWISSHSDRAGERLKALELRLRLTSDEGRIKVWSNGELYD